MSAATPPSAALQVTDAAARILLDAGRLAARQVTVPGDPRDTARTNAIALALQSVVREAKRDGYSDHELFKALAVTVAMFQRNQALAADQDVFLSVFGRQVRACAETARLGWRAPGEDVG